MIRGTTLLADLSVFIVIVAALIVYHPVRDGYSFF